MNNQNTQHLLEQVSVISNKYKDIAKITGENFNIFQILDMSTSEVSLHSKLIAELLNPYGTHDQGALFLKLFIDECGLTDFLADTDLAETSVNIEVHTGKISEDYESGGRVDIVLNFNNTKTVLIENKIHANDQYNQLGRYKKAYSNSKIVYLNLWGDKEEILEIGGLPKSEFIWISYADNITNWLTNSLKEVYNKPNIVYILEHYLKTVKTITNQNTNSIMNKELIDLLINSTANLNAAEEIRNTLNLIDNMLLDFNTLTNKWLSKIKSTKRELVVFTQDNIEYTFRPTIEKNTIVFHIFPEPFGSADNTIHAILKKTINELYPLNKPNPNYIGWIESKFNKSNLSPEQLGKFLKEGNNENWANEIIDEGIILLRQLSESLPINIKPTEEFEKLIKPV